MYILGTSLIIIAILAALVSSACYALVVSGRRALLRWGRVGTWTALLFASGSAMLLLALFVMQRYDVRYVYDYSSVELEMRFRIAAIWAGQPGSLVVWALVGLICAPFLIGRTHQFEPYVLALLMLLHALLLVFVLARNPFIPTVIDGLVSAPPDGRGLNPILHNVWMVIQPPTLFTGNGLLGVVFCMALAGLWRRDYDGWVRMAFPWAIAGWAVLGLALMMSGYWAYESLGWGDDQGWDPIENAALVPWLTGTALIHGLLLQRTHGVLRRANFCLAILTYGFVFYVSFLTRSGVLSSFAVDSFVDEGLQHVIIGVLVAIVTLGTTLLVLRWRDIPRRPLSGALLSRDTMLVLMMLTLVVIGIVIAFGTSIPWITSINGLGAQLQSLFSFEDGRFGLQPNILKWTAPPLGLVLAILLTIGPLLGWRGTSAHKLLLSLRWPFVAAVTMTSAGIILGVRDALSIAYLLLAAFALGTNFLMIVRTLRSGWLRIGGYVAHVGMALLLVGIIGSYVYASPEKKLFMAQGEIQAILGHTFSFAGYEERPSNKYVMRFLVDQETDRGFVAFPEIYFNERMETWVRTPAIKRSLWQDLYIRPEQYIPPEDPNTVTLKPGEQGQIGPYTIHFDEFALQQHMSNANEVLVGATVTITHENDVQRRTPWMHFEPDRMRSSLPVALGDGHHVVLEEVIPGEDSIRLRITGLDLPIPPALAMFTVSTKPAIALVWTGAALMIIGGSFAVLRRRWETEAVRESFGTGTVSDTGASEQVVNRELPVPGS